MDDAGGDGLAGLSADGLGAGAGAWSGFAGQIPTFVLAPFAGVLVDRLDRRKLLVWTQVLAAVQSLALAALTLAKVITVHEIIGLSVFQGLINAFDMPGRQSFLVQMVEDKQDLSNAIALNSSMVNLARLVGPALAGMVIGGGWARDGALRSTASAISR